MEPPSTSHSIVDHLSAFGVRGAGTYDDDAARMPTRYKIAHTIQNELIVNVLDSCSSRDVSVVVDLGAGTANDGLDILNQAARTLYLGIDNSLAMIERAKDKMRVCGYSERSAFLTGDFRTITASDVTRVLQSEHMEGSITVVMSALALHHYELAEKRAVYNLAYDLLHEGGVFVSTDLFSNSIADCARHALSKEISDVQASAERAGRLSSAPKEATTLSVDHYVRCNKPQWLSKELALLHDIGFGSIDIVYREGQMAVLVAGRIE